MSWIHNEVATHSPFLDVVSPDEGSGKTELQGILGLLTPRPCFGAEFTGPNIYRTVDHDQPTLIIDEADDAFLRKPDLKHIVNHSWTRGAKISRQVRIDGELQTYWFNTFCPKIIGHVLLSGKPLPRTITSRGICIKMFPKRPDEHVEEFQHRDDERSQPCAGNCCASPTIMPRQLPRSSRPSRTGSTIDSARTGNCCSRSPTSPAAIGRSVRAKRRNSCRQA